MMNRKQAGWSMDYWSGFTPSGKARLVSTPHYRDHAWHRAYVNTVRAELEQAVGRGRGFLPEGMPVFVVTRENLAPPGIDDGRHGYPLNEVGTFTLLTVPGAKALALVKGKPGISTAAVAKLMVTSAKPMGITPEMALRHLTELAKAGRVRRLSKKAGWVAP
jgi:hypothetical protein